MKKQVFKGVGVAIITPMNKDGSVNYPMLDTLLDFQIENGSDSIVICGTTGESSTMSDSEHIDVIAHTVEYVDHRIPVVAGAGSNDTAYAVWLSKESRAAGADALLQVTPYYNKTSQRGLIKHFEAIADATDLPIILYNVPSRTGVNITIDTYKALAKNPNIVATKEASGDISHVAKIIEACGDELAIYSGNDDQIIPILALGGVGVISVLANVLPRQTHEVCRLFFENDISAAKELMQKLLPLANALFMDVNPIPVKEAVNIMGYDVGECRLPLVKMEEDKIETLKAVMQQAGIKIR